MTEQMVVDCTSGTVSVMPLSPDEQAAIEAQSAQAQQQAQAAAAQAAFRQQQQAALVGVSTALHGAQAASDAAALAGLVHNKLCADPPLPLSAPEQATLVRFMLRCLLP